MPHSISLARPNANAISLASTIAIAIANTRESSSDGQPTKKSTDLFEPPQFMPD